MKTLKINMGRLFVALSAVLVFFGACRDDLSSLDLNPIEGVVIDTSGMGRLDVFQFDVLHVNPVIRTNLSESDLEYLWTITKEPNSLDYDTIGTSKELTYEVNLKPIVPSGITRYYRVHLKVTDKNTGIAYLAGWELNVRNSIGEGLIVAETHDGSTTDLSHIMSPLVTPNFNETRIRHGIYSSLNGATLPGIVHQLRYTRLRQLGGIIHALTANSVLGIRSEDYLFHGADEDYFYNPPAVYRPQLIGSVLQGDVIVNNGQMHRVWLEISNKWGVPFDTEFVLPDHIALNGNHDYPNNEVNFYDAARGAFVYQATTGNFGDRTQRVMAPATTPFNPANLPGKEVVAAHVNVGHDFIHVLKDKSGPGFGIYVNDGGAYQVAPAPKAYYDISSAPEIANAKHFVILDDQNVIYYATDTKIYAIMYASAVPAYDLRYTLPAGETISTLQVYRQADYPKRWDDSYISTNNRQLVMSTYNGSEGKVYLMPFRTLGLAIIDEANITKYEGFGRVTAIGTQL